MKTSRALYLLFLISTAIRTLCASEELVSVNLNAITISKSIRDIQYQTEGRMQTLSIFENLRTPTFKYNGPPTLTFYKESKTKLNESGEPLLEAVGRVTIPEKSGDFLLIFSHPDVSSERYVVLALPDSISKFRPGMSRFINLTTFDIAIETGKVRKIITKRNYIDVDSKGIDGEIQKTTMYSLIVQPTGDLIEPLRAFSGGLNYSEEHRNIYLISPKTGGRNGRIQITAIPERVRK